MPASISSGHGCWRRRLARPPTIASAMRRSSAFEQRKQGTMPIKYPEVMNLKTEGVPYAWSDREVMLYALGIGMGEDPLNEKELLFVNEGYINKKPLKVVPTFASVCAWGASPGQIDLNRVMVVDGGRDISFHRPLPVTGKVAADSSVLGVYDKGKEKGAVIQRQTVVKDAASGEKLVTIVS